MITRQDMDKVIAQVNSILADMHKRIDALETELSELQHKQLTRRPRKVDTSKEGN